MCQEVGQAPHGTHAIPNIPCSQKISDLAVWDQRRSSGASERASGERQPCVSLGTFPKIRQLHHVADYKLRKKLAGIVPSAPTYCDESRAK